MSEDHDIPTPKLILAEFTTMIKTSDDDLLVLIATIRGARTHQNPDA